jgi:ATP-dependent helicase/nuclease subunit B
LARFVYFVAGGDRLSLRFILGRAGTGKTTYCLAQIAEELQARPQGSSIILLVPEQGTFQMEAALAAWPGLNGTMRAHVYSFRRLAWKVLQEAGGAARPHLREIGKRMVLRNLLEQRRDDLKVFYRAARQPNFSDSLARVIAEMKMYCLTPAQLTSAAAFIGAKNNLLRNKLEDLALLYLDLEQFLAGRFTDPEDYLNLLADRLAYSSTCLGSEVWVDGFSGFTPQEYRVLSKLLTVSARVNVALCLDPTILGQPLDEQELFYRTHQTYDTLLEMAQEAGVTVEDPCVFEPTSKEACQTSACRFANNPVLRHLEQHFFTRPRPPFAGVASGIKLVAAHNRRAEIEGVAREIVALARDQGYRWRDISVLTRDLTLYDELVDRVFADYGIPCFIDYKRPVRHHPLVELIRSALEVVGTRWAYDSVFRYLKTDFISVTREEVDLLENYVLAHGIRGTRWTDGQPWTYRRYYSIGDDREPSAKQVEELAEINRIKEAAVRELASFSAAIQESSTVREISLALYQLLTDLGVKEKMEVWATEAQAAGRLDRSREYAQLYNQVILLLDEIVEALGEQELPVEDYLKVLEAGLENLRLGLIPPGLDQVFVGTLDRSRNPRVRANFLLGINDGILPARITSQGLLSDQERELLLNSGLKLAPTDQRSLFDEQYLIYLGLTRASEYLWLSYSLADQEGNALTPSTLIKELKEILPDLEETVCPLEPGVGDELSFIAHPIRAFTYLTSQLREVKTGQELRPIWRDVYNWALSHARPASAIVVGGLFHQNQETSLQPATRVGLYGTRLRVSVTRIEQFRACPFAHFVRYGLAVRERETAKLQPLDLGQFFHAALKNFVERLLSTGLDWTALTLADCQPIIEEIIEQLVPQLKNEIMLGSQRQRYLIHKLREIVLHSAWALLEQTRCGSFRPIKLELGFGYPDELPPVELVIPRPTDADQVSPKAARLQLIGRIDRLDLARSAAGSFVRVIDYKSGAARLNLAEIYYGLNLQLLTYLEVALTNAGRLFDNRLANGQLANNQLVNSQIAYNQIANNQLADGEEVLPGGILYFGLKNPVINAKGPLPPEEIARKIRQSYKLKGLVLGDRELIELMERGLTGNSDLIPVGFKKDGNFTSRSAVISREQFTLLRQHLHRALLEAGQAILTGEVALEPYQLKKQRACTYCRFRPICQFDPLIGNRYRNLRDLTDKELWEQLGKEGDQS